MSPVPSGFHRPALPHLASQPGAQGHRGSQRRAAMVPVMSADQYPAARRLDLTEDLLGHRVSDPYRWLEDTGSNETRAWLGAEDELFRSHAAALPGVTGLAERILELTGAGHIGVPVWRGPRRFFTRRLPGEEHAVLCTVIPAPGTRPIPAPGIPPIPARPPGPSRPRGPRPSRRPPDAHRPGDHRPERADHPRQLAAGQGGPVAGLPAVRGRQRGVAAAGDRRGNQRAGGRPDRPLPLLLDRLAAGGQGVLLHPPAAPTRCPQAKSSSTAGSTCTGWAPPPPTTC